MRTFGKDLEEKLKDPEFAAYFANAQVESAKELLKSGVLRLLTSTSLRDKLKHFTIKKWR